MIGLPLSLPSHSLCILLSQLICIKSCLYIGGGGENVFLNKLDAVIVHVQTIPVDSLRFFLMYFQAPWITAEVIDDIQLRLDLENICNGPMETKNNYYVLSALCDIHKLFSKSKLIKKGKYILNKIQLSFFLTTYLLNPKVGGQHGHLPRIFTLKAVKSESMDIFHGCCSVLCLLCIALPSAFSSIRGVPQ